MKRIGATTLEYCVCAVLILGVVIGTVAVVGQRTGESFDTSADKIEEALE